MTIIETIYDAARIAEFACKHGSAVTASRGGTIAVLLVSAPHDNPALGAIITRLSRARSHGWQVSLRRTSDSVRITATGPAGSADSLIRHLNQPTTTAHHSAQPHNKRPKPPPKRSPTAGERADRLLDDHLLPGRPQPDAERIRCSIVVVDDWPAPRLIEPTADLLSRLATEPPELRQPLHTLRAVHPAAVPATLTSNDPRAHLTELRWGRRIPSRSHPDIAPLEVAATGLGGCLSAALRQRLRDDMALCYHPTASIHYRSALGIFRLAVAIPPAHAPTATAVVERELHALATINNDRADHDRNAYLGSLIAETSTAHGYASFLAAFQRAGLSIDALRERLDRIHSCSAKDVQKIARRWLAPTDMTHVSVVPATHANGEA